MSYRGARDRASWRALLAVYVSVPMGVVAILILYHEGHLGDTPPGVLIALVGITAVLNLISFVRLRNLPDSGPRVQFRLAVAALTTAAVLYATGWGSFFVIGYAVGVSEVVRNNGSKTWRGALGWNAAGILGGEIAIQIGLAPSVLPVRLAHEAAAFGFCCLVLVTRVLVLTGRAVEDAEDQLRERSEYFESLVAHASDVIGVVDADGVIAYLSPAIEATLGYSPVALLGRPLTTIADPADGAQLERLVAALATAPSDIQQCDIGLCHRDGSTRRSVITLTSRATETSHAIVVNLHDVTIERALEEQLRFDAMHDPLTGMWNRAALAEAVEKASAAARRDHDTIALLFIDVDGFKQVNDTLGHDRGDRLLTTIADTIQRCLRVGDLLGRWGGDEFMALLNRVQDSADPIAVAQRILDELETVTAGEPDGAQVTVSIGIASDPGGELPVSELARRADEAMYRAKRAGRARFVISGSDATEDATIRLRSGAHHPV